MVLVALILFILSLVLLIYSITLLMGKMERYLVCLLKRK